MRTIEKLKQVAGETKLRFRNRARSVNRGLLKISRAARQQGEGGREKVQRSYGKLLVTARRVVGTGERVVQELLTKVKRSRNKQQREKAAVLAQQTTATIALVRRVMTQTKARVFGGDQHYGGKVLSIFEPDTEAIRKGKANKPTEFGKLVEIQEAENQIVVDYEVYDQRPDDASLLLPAIAKHIAVFGRAPRLLAADAAFFSTANEAAAEAAGVKATKSATRRARQHQRWFRRAQRWRVGCEGRISVLTNAIESLNMSLRKVTKARGSFPNDEAVSKLLYLALRNIAKKWTMPVHAWKDALNRFAIIYEDRLPAS